MDFYWGGNSGNCTLCSNSGTRGNRNCWQAGHEQSRLRKESVKSGAKTLRRSYLLVSIVHISTHVIIRP